MFLKRQHFSDRYSKLGYAGNKEPQFIMPSAIAVKETAKVGDEASRRLAKGVEDLDFFIGDEEYMYGDAAQMNYDNRARSVIVTGCSAWTLYQFNNYQGERLCVWPANTAACYPGFYTTGQSLGLLAGQVSSARKGCFAKRSVMPDNYEPEGKAAVEGASRGGASGFFPARNHLLL